MRGSRPAYVSVGKSFPTVAKWLVECIKALGFVDTADL